jgi:hypothetical protein
VNTKEIDMGKKTLLSVAAVVAAAGVMMAAPAEARTSVTLAIGGGVPYGYAYPGYGYVQPGYVQPYVQPGYVYTQPSYVYPQPAYVAPQVYIGGGYGGYGYGYGQRGYYSGRGDRDHDGVPNRFDRAPRNPRRF